MFQNKLLPELEYVRKEYEGPVILERIIPQVSFHLRPPHLYPTTTKYTQHIFSFLYAIYDQAYRV